MTDSRTFYRRTDKKLEVVLSISFAMMDPTQPPSLKRQKIDGLPFSVVLNVDIESDRPIKSICTGFSLELKNNVANSIDVVRKLIAESHPENYGLELTEPQQYSSVETMFHVDLKEKNTTLNSAFNFAHDIARKNHEKLNFIEPTFDIILPEKIESKSYRFGSIL